MGAAGRTVAASLVALVLSVTPAFLLGGVAVLLRRDLGFSESGLGLAISAFYLASSMAAVHGGRLAERLGGLRAAGLGVLVSCTSLLGIAALAQRLWHLLAFQALAGLANALVQPATNLALARAVPFRRQGVAFGLKQTNGPVATLLAGVSAALIAVTIGWRWAFALPALGAFAFFLLRPPGWRSDRPPPARVGGAADAPVPALVLMAIGSGFAVAAASAFIGFYVESAVAAGIAVATAGWWFAAGSLLGTVARVAWGWVVDRRGSHGFGLMTLLLVTGAAGFALLGISVRPIVLAPATLLAFIAGWGWFGLILFAVVQVSPNAPARATGIIIAGVSGGGIVGPPVFGLLVERIGYPVAWSATAVALLLAAACIQAGGRVRRSPSPIHDRPG